MSRPSRSASGILLSTIPHPDGIELAPRLSSLSNRTWDVAIVGGGPAGCAAATLLAPDAKVLLIDPQTQRSRHAFGESVAPLHCAAIEALLEESELAECSRRTYSQASVWGGPEIERFEFLFTPHGYGLRLDRPHFDAALRRRAQRAGARFAVAKIRDCTRAGDDLAMALCSKDRCETIRARVAIDASGSHRALARCFGAPVETHDQLFAVARRYRSGSEKNEDFSTLVEAVPHGWWYSATLPDGDRVVVAHSDKDLPLLGSIVSDRGFESELARTKATSSYLTSAGYVAATSVVGAPAMSRRLRRSSGERWLAIGDAAQSYDPLASQGIAMALESAREATKAVRSRLAGSPRSFNGYQRWLDRNWTEYGVARDQHYAGEPRWRTNEFWRRRTPAVRHSNNQGNDQGEAWTAPHP